MIQGKIAIAKFCRNAAITISSFIFTTFNYFSVINSFNFENFISQVASGYKLNPYHCALHAADITQTTLVFVQHTGFQKDLKLTIYDMIALYLSCVVHDYKHPGLTNGYLVTAKDSIATTYNDKSVLENYHISESFSLINSDKKYDIFQGVGEDNYKLIRKRMIENVLSTDMTGHQQHLLFIKQQSGLVKNGQTVGEIMEGLDGPNKFDTQQKYMSVVIHASDISNPTKPLEVYKLWAQRVIDEFFLQGDKEANEHKKISFLCDRHTVTLGQSQLGFIEAVVKPYFLPICDTFTGIEFYRNNLDTNIEYFKKLKEEEEKAKEEKKKENEKNEEKNKENTKDTGNNK